MRNNLDRRYKIDTLSRWGQLASRLHILKRIGRPLLSLPKATEKISGVLKCCYPFMVQRAGKANTKITRQAMGTMGTPHVSTLPLRPFPKATEKIRRVFMLGYLIQGAEGG